LQLRLAGILSIRDEESQGWTMHRRWLKINQARDVQVLCLQLQRVRWTNSGSLEKLHGHIAFPLCLELSPCCTAAAEPLLGRRVQQPAGNWEGPAQAVQHPSYQTSVIPEQQQRVPTAASQSAEKGLDFAQVLPPCTGQASAPLPEQHNIQGVGIRGMHSCRSIAQHVADKAAPSARCRIGPSRHYYRLVAVIVHHGSARSGHYTTYRSLRTRSDQQDDFIGNSSELWVSASDEDVRAADMREVLACQASILLYEKIPI